MFSRMPLAIALALFVCACEGQTLTYQIDASLVAPKNRNGKKPGEMVQITLPGQKFDPPVEIELVQKSAVDRSTPEGVLRSMRSANLAGDPDWIVENFLPRDEAKLRQIFSNPDVLAKSRSYYATVQRIQVLESARIREYTILIAREQSANNTSVRPIPMLKTASGWRATNDLANDATLDLVWLAVADRR